MKVQRWEYIPGNGGCDSSKMSPLPWGDYVLHVDYAASEQRAEELHKLQETYIRKCSMLESVAKAAVALDSIMLQMLEENTIEATPELRAKWVKLSEALEEAGYEPVD